MEWVGFPGLGIDKIFLKDYLFKLFGIEIKWYAIIVVSAILISVSFGFLMCKNFGLDRDYAFDVTIFGVIFGIVGARVYYVVFNFSEFSGDFLKILNLRSGGLAIYGGIIASFSFGFIYTRLKKTSFLPLSDIASVCFLLAQSIGRWGNFVNIEAYGTKTNLPWGMTSSKIPIALQPVHPTFFYESLWCFLGFLLLLFLMKKRRFNGQLFLTYGLWYSFGRFFIEGLRTDSLWLVKDYIRVSQLLSFLLFFVSAFLYIYILFFYIKKNKNKEIFNVNFEKDRKGE